MFLPSALQVCLQHPARGVAKALPPDDAPAGTLSAHTYLQQRFGQQISQSLGELLLPRRHASSGHLRGAVKALLADAALQPDMEHVDGTGRLLAAAVAGASGGLHSRAPEVLALVLQEDLVTPADFRSSKVGRICLPACGETCSHGIINLGRLSLCPGTPVGVRLLSVFGPDRAAGVRLLGAVLPATPADIQSFQGQRSCPLPGLHVVTEGWPRASSWTACTGGHQRRWQRTLSLLQSHTFVKVGTAGL